MCTTAFGCLSAPRCTTAFGCLSASQRTPSCRGEYGTLPAMGALDTGAVQRLFARAETEVAEGRLPACQLALVCGDEVAASTFGWASASSRFVLFSITKSLIAG